VLLRLLVGQGSSVSVDRLLTDLYEGAPPPSALSGLRRTSPTCAARWSRTGRSGPHPQCCSPRRPAPLRLPADALDADAFAADLQAEEQLAGADPSRAVAHLDAALARWRGEAYAEVAFEPWVVPEAVRLTEQRSRAQERRAELALTAQGGAAVVAELEALVREHPVREETWRLLALALYDAGRQGDALAVLRRAREVLAGELGQDPGEVLNADSGRSGRFLHVIQGVEVSLRHEVQRSSAHRTAHPCEW
jgi:DNA-binding SARP family transcriptional activator